MIYRIVNPSDPYTIEANSLEVAAIACLFLGRGQYAFDPEQEGAEKVPLFMFGDTDEWFRQHFNVGLKESMDRVVAEHAEELADCLDSCLIGNFADRKAYYLAFDLIDDPEKKKQYRDAWLDERQSSLNNIGGRAFAMASKLRAGSKNPLKGNMAPQQIFSV